ncbi:MAG: hypothetical protein AB7D06_17110 [Pedobacter sp.]
MTKDDWAKVEKALSGTYGYAIIQADGRRVTFQRCMVGENRLGIRTYIDGTMDGAWMMPKNECPERVYLRPDSRYIHSPKQRAKLKKLTKRVLKEMGDYWNPDAKYLIYNPSWPNATAIRRHYQKTFESIELIEVVG